MIRIRITARKTLNKLVWALFAVLASTVMFSALWDPHSRKLPSEAAAKSGAAPVVISAHISARVASALVSPGMSVKAGQTLALLESPELDSELDLANSRLRSAEAMLDSARTKSEGADRRTEVKEAKEALRVALQRALAQRVTVPMAGKILEVSVHPGDRVTPGQPLFKMSRIPPALSPR